MNQDNVLIDNLLGSAEKSGNKKAISKLKDKRFIEKLNEVVSVLESIGYEPAKVDATPITDAEKQVYIEITKTLATDYFTLYYVNLLTDYYIGYSTNPNYNKLAVEESGENFFEDVIKNARKVIYSEDKDRLLKALTKEAIIAETENGKPFEITYRLLLNKKPTYVTLKATRLEKEKLIIGLANVNEQKLKEIEEKKTLSDSITYSNIALSLIQNYFRIYYVNIETDDYVQYSIDNESKQLIVEEEGIKFFDECTVQAKKFLPKEYQEPFLKLLNKETLLKELEKNKKANLEYKLYIGGFKPENLVNVGMVALKIYNDDKHIIIANSDIDARVKKEEEYARQLELQKRLARQDALTGCQNRSSYLEHEKMINEKITEGVPLEFSVVIFDINDLKLINDTYGHDAGDKAIVEAKNMIEKIFKNSTTFRIGGDEFALILEGTDYYKRDFLVNEFISLNKKNKQKKNQVVVSCGISDFVHETDQKFISVFIRADRNMYDNKRELKS